MQQRLKTRTAGRTAGGFALIVRLKAAQMSNIVEHCFDVLFIDCAVLFALQDEFSHLVQEWNTQRMNALARAFNQMLYPLFEKELKLKLLEEAKASVIDVRIVRL